MIEQPKVSIVIAHLFGVDYIVNCLTSIYQSDYQNLEVVIFFNGNQDHSFELVGKKFPQAVRILHHKNLGFVEANNRAIEKSQGELIFLLNDDTIIDSHLVSHLVEEIISSENIGIVGPKIFYMDEPQKIWFAGGKIDWQRQQSSHLGRNLLDREYEDKRKEVDFITGCALMIKKEVIEKVGLMDKIYFAFYEDADWCQRVKRAGYQVVYIPFGGVWHVKSATAGKTIFGQEKEKNYFWLLGIHFKRSWGGKLRKYKNKFIFYNRFVPARFRLPFYFKFFFVDTPVLVWEILFQIPFSALNLAWQKLK